MSSQNGNESEIKCIQCRISIVLYQKFQISQRGKTMNCEISRDLVKKTLQAIHTVNAIPDGWYALCLLKYEKHDPAYELEIIIKNIVMDNLAKWRKLEGIPDHYPIRVNHNLSHDLYIKQDDLYTALQRDIGDRKVAVELKQWSILYHTYFVDHVLTHKEISQTIDYTERQLSNYLNDGIDRLTRCLQNAEADAFRQQQVTAKLAPRTIYERHAQVLVEEAQNLLDQSQFELALAKCDEASDYAEKHGVPLAFVHAHTVKAYALLQGDAQAVQVAVHLLDTLECRFPELHFSNDFTQAQALIAIKIQQAFLSKRMGRMKAAITLATEATKLAVPIQKTSPKICFDAFHIQGTMLWADGHYYQALKAYDQAIRIATENDIASIQVYFPHGMKGLIYWSLCQYTQAKQCFEKSIEYAETYAHYWLVAYEQGNLGLVFLSQGEIEKSRRIFQYQSSLAEQYNLNAELIRAQANLGIVSLHRGNFIQARQLLERSKVNFEDLSKLEGLCVVCVNLSQLYTYVGNHKHALEMALYALNIAENRLGGSPPACIIALRCVSGCETAERMIRHTALQEALGLAKKTERRFDEAACLLGLAFFATDPDQKHDLWRQGEAILHGIDAASWLKKLTPTSYPHLLLIM
jgi:tetratricopeptide (TPR) repeat protein